MDAAGPAAHRGGPALNRPRTSHATLLLAAGVNPKVVSERLGHQGIGITLDIYGHVLPTMGRHAATLWAQSIEGAAVISPDRTETEQTG